MHLYLVKLIAQLWVHPELQPGVITYFILYHTELELGGGGGGDASKDTVWSQLGTFTVMFVTMAQSCGLDAALL